MQIDWWTLALQAVNFLALVWILNRFLYRPVKTAIEARRTLSERALREAEQKAQQAEAERQRLESANRAFDAERDEALRKVHAEIEAERKEALEHARLEAEKVLAENREKVRREQQDAVAASKTQIAALALELAKTILDRADPGDAGAADRRKAEAFLDGLPVGEIARLRADLDRTSASLSVVTAAELSPDAREAWAASLRERLGDGIDPRFVVEPEIVGGVDLRFPHSDLRLSWQHALAEASERMRAEQDDD